MRPQSNHVKAVFLLKSSEVSSLLSQSNHVKAVKYLISSIPRIPALHTNKASTTDASFSEICPSPFLSTFSSSPAQGSSRGLGPSANLYPPSSTAFKKYGSLNWIIGLSSVHSSSPWFFSHEARLSAIIGNMNNRIFFMAGLLFMINNKNDNQTILCS